MIPDRVQNQWGTGVMRDVALPGTIFEQTWMGRASLHRATSQRCCGGSRGCRAHAPILLNCSLRSCVSNR